MLLDMLPILLTGSKELFVGQVDSLLVVGNSTKGVERRRHPPHGRSDACLGGRGRLPSQPSGPVSRSPLYGWVNVKAFVDTLTRKSAEAEGVRKRLTPSTR